MHTNGIVLLGAGGQARETYSYIRSLNQQVAFWSVSQTYAPNSEEISFAPLEELTDAQRKMSVICSVGAPRIKKDLIEQFRGTNFVNVISASAFIAYDANFGIGVTCAPGAVVSSAVQIGSHVLINVGATISHDAEVGDFATIGPGVNIGGNVTVGEGTVIGIGATIKHGVTIGSHTYIGAGSIVLNDIDDHVVAFGTPATTKSQRQGWIDEL